ncbi:hypothetical protein LshimejAT787_0410770 [Lyophyllum shimeji]|uniref:F-box domain-containing protein n=1 Tax=Lyophyllum shimeji TaxID=47721 RepID=A0A9P3PMH7_LYOSH|nr:hypothetical protein LshimejAT787_0410770 [Lyophyllum shimeji]
MHRCLTMPEIQALVFGCIQSWDLGTVTLARLTRTCTAFKETALDALWSDLETLGLLVQVMPADLWTTTIEKGKRDQPIKILRFTRGLQESDWSRFDYYALRIRKLGFRTRHPLPIIYIHDTALKALIAFRPDSPLLPCLREFKHASYYEPLHSTALPFIPSLLGDSVTAISLWLLAVQVDELCGLLSSLSQRCPGLSSVDLELSDTPTTPETTSVIERFVCSLHGLKAINLVPSLPASSPTLLHLANLPELRLCHTLDIPFDANVAQLHELFTAISGRFPRLDNFMFHVQALDQAASIIHSLQRPLGLLAVEVPQGLERPSIQPFPSLAKLTRCFAHHACASSLKHLSIDGYNIEFEEVPSPDAIRGAYSSLFSLRALEALDISLPFTSELDDDWFAEAARAWPHLTSLRVYHYHQGRPKLTLAGLIPLVVHCRHLHELTVIFSAEPFDLGLLPPGVCNLAITSLDLNDCPIDSPALVGECLLAMFPNLTGTGYVSHDYEEEEENWQAWSMLEELLQERIEGSDDSGEARMDVW